MDEPLTADEIFRALGSSCGLSMLRMRAPDEETGREVVWIEAWSRDGRRYRVLGDCEHDAAIALAEALGVDLWDDAPPRRG